MSKNLVYLPMFNLFYASIRFNTEVQTSKSTAKSITFLDKRWKQWRLEKKEIISFTQTKFEFSSDNLTISLEPPNVGLLGRHFKVNPLFHVCNS